MEFIESTYFILISANYVATINTVQELFNEISMLDRQYKNAKKEIYVLYTLEQVQAICRARHAYLCYSAGITPLPIPTDGSPLIRRSNETGNAANTMLAVKTGAIQTFGLAGFWVLAASNGFFITSDVQPLLQVLDAGTFCYPHVVYTTGIDAMYAEYLARTEYLSIFYNRYGASSRTIMLPPVPLKDGEVFVDPLYQARESNYDPSCTLRELQSRGLL
jgi:hypothetical protein